MTIQLHETARVRLQEKLQVIRLALIRVARSIAETEDQDIVSARHIDDALQTLLPPKRQHLRRKQAGFWAGVILGVSFQAVIQNLLKIRDLTSFQDILGLIVWSMIFIVGLFLAFYSNN